MTGTQLFIALLVAVGGASALFLIWQVDPAWTISAGLGLTMFAGDWQLWGLPAFIAPDRLLLATGVLAVIARAPGARHRRPVLFRPVHWLLLVVLAYGACSLLVGTASGQSLNSGSIFHWLDRLGFMPFLVFLVAPVVFQTSRQRTILLATLGLMGAYLGLTALFETVGPHALVFPSYILDPSVGIHSGRARGPFLEAVANGIGLYAGAVAAVIIATTAKRQFWRWAGILVAILCCLGIVFTLQRGIWPRAAPIFASDSVWNARLPDALEPPSNSPSLVSELQRQVAAYGSNVNTSTWSTPVYTVAAQQPTVHVQLVVGRDAALQDAFATVPIPPGAKPSPDSDSHLVVWQPSTDRMWEFWKASNNDGTWQARWGGVMEHVSESNGYFENSSWLGAKSYWGATATSLPLLGGLMRAQELSAGKIDHALSFAAPAVTAGTYQWPAQRSDGTIEHGGIPEGTEFRLDPNLDIAALGLPKITEIMALAVQRYGMILRDKGGAVGFFAENPMALTSDPYPEIFQGLRPWQFMARFPWGHLEVVSPSDHPAYPS